MASGQRKEPTEKELIPKYTSSACSTLPEKKKPTNQPNKQTKKTQQNKQKEKKNKNKHPS